MRPGPYLFGAALALLGLVTAAGAGKPPGEPAADRRLMRTESGLKYRDLAIGHGRKAVAGDTVTIHYVGWLANGAKIDDSRARKKPATFRIGAAKVIRGWEEGVTGMRVRGKRKLLLPPALGYGARGEGIFIPPNATLMYEVELVDLR